MELVKGGGHIAEAEATGETEGETEATASYTANFVISVDGISASDFDTTAQTNFKTVVRLAPRASHHADIAIRLRITVATTVAAPAAPPAQQLM